MRSIAASLVVLMIVVLVSFVGCRSNESGIVVEDLIQTMDQYGECLAQGATGTELELAEHDYIEAKRKFDALTPDQRQDAHSERADEFCEAAAKMNEAKLQRTMADAAANGEKIARERNRTLGRMASFAERE